MNLDKRMMECLGLVLPILALAFAALPLQASSFIHEELACVHAIRVEIGDLVGLDSLELSKAKDRLRPELENLIQEGGVALDSSATTVLRLTVATEQHESVDAFIVTTHVDVMHPVAIVQEQDLAEAPTIIEGILRHKSFSKITSRGGVVEEIESRAKGLTRTVVGEIVQAKSSSVCHGGERLRDTSALDQLLAGLEESLAADEARLSQALTSLDELLGSEDSELLAEVQALWRSYSTSHCEAVHGPAPGVQPDQVGLILCLRQQVRQRIRDLREYDRRGQERAK